MKVHMIYTGIIAIIRSPSDGSAFVCMPETKGQTRHYPHVAVENGCHTAKNLQSIGAGRGQTAYDIDGFTMSITSTATSPGLRVFGKYFLELERGCSPTAPGCSKINGSLLRGPSSPLVAASTTLRQGRLEASYVDRDYMWRFADPLMGGAMWLAQEITHTFEIEQPQLRLAFGRGRSLTVGAPAGQDIEVRVGHTLKRDIFPKGSSKAPAEDKHVRMYHGLSAVPTPTPSRRRLVPVKNIDGLSKPPQDSPRNKFLRLGGATIADLEDTRRVGGSNCPPALMKY